MKLAAQASLRVEYLPGFSVGKLLMSTELGLSSWTLYFPEQTSELAAWRRKT